MSRRETTSNINLLINWLKQGDRARAREWHTGEFIRYDVEYGIVDECGAEVPATLLLTVDMWINEGFFTE